MVTEIKCKQMESEKKSLNCTLSCYFNDIHIQYYCIRDQIRKPDHLPIVFAFVTITKLEKTFWKPEKLHGNEKSVCLLFVYVCLYAACLSVLLLLSIQQRCQTLVCLGLCLSSVCVWLSVCVCVYLSFLYHVNMAQVCAYSHVFYIVIIVAVIIPKGVTILSYQSGVHLTYTRLVYVWCSSDVHLISLVYI